MVIHCLACGKSISSQMEKCPYCIAQITDITLEMNGLEVKPRFKEKVRELVFGFVHK